MWKEELMGQSKGDRSFRRSIVAASSIASLFLSLLCSLFFNIWQYDVEQILLEEGDWQGRILRELEQEELDVIRQFAGVEKVLVRGMDPDGGANGFVCGPGSARQEPSVDIYLKDPRKIYQVMPKILEQLGLDEEAAIYHERLLSRYLIHDPKDDRPPLLLSFYLFLLACAAAALVLIIRNPFAVSMYARTRQFGLLAGIGATPGQIRSCLLKEAATLCLLPILAGDGIGVLLSAALLGMLERMAAGIAGRHTAVFRYHPLLFGGTFLLSALTVLFSAWLPARRLSRVTPLEAIRSGEDLSLKKGKKGRRPLLLSLLFGIEGELAGNSLRARKTALRTTELSLTLSFFVFTLFSCFAAISRLSVYETSFSRYQDFWDIMATVEDTPIGDFGELEQVSAIEGIESAVLYQKAEAYVWIDPAMESEELAGLGGLGVLDERAERIEGGNGAYRVKAPLLVLDDAGFTAYCQQLGIERRSWEGADHRLEGGIVLDRIWDSLHSDLRHREYVPFLQKTDGPLILRDKAGEEIAALPVLACAMEGPVLWEEYEDYSLVQIIPLSLWETFSDKVDTVEPELYLRIFVEEDGRWEESRSPESLQGFGPVVAAIEAALAGYPGAKVYDRIQALAEDDRIWQGYMAMMSGSCILLALIGIADIFSHTLGSVYERRQEFARYVSVGVTPGQIRKILWIEALVVAGRPVLITLPLTAAAVVFMAKASYMEIGKFLAVAPVGPIAFYILWIFFFVGLAHHLGERRIRRCDLNEVLRSSM